MGREGLGRRLGILIVVSILVFGVMCGVIIKLNIRQGDNEAKESPLVGFLAFEYDEVGLYGSLYYQTFIGEKTHIADHVLGKDSNYFILDERRRLVFYKDENSALYMAEIGKEPKQIVASIDKTGIEESKSGRYLFCLTYDEDGFISYVIIDKEERVTHEVGTGLSTEQLDPNFSTIIFDEEALMFCYVDKENNLYCSTAYEAPQLIAEKVRDYVSQAKGIILYAASDQEEGSYTFLNGPMKGEQLKAEYISEFLVENIEGEAVAFFRGRQEDGSGLYMQRKGEESILLAIGNVRNFHYTPQESKLYYLDGESNLMSLDISIVDSVGRGKEKKLATDMSDFSISPNGKMVIGKSDFIFGGKNLYLMTEEGAVLLDDHVEESKALDNYVTYFQRKDGRISLMRYTTEQGIQMLIANVDDYSMIIINNQFYKSPLKYGQVVGYYANEAFDILLEMGKNQEMIVYSGGQEIGRVAFEVGKSDERKEIKLSPLSGRDFTVDVFKDTFWNDEIFLSMDSIFTEAGYEEKNKLILGDKTLTLSKLDEATFRNQLKGQAQASKKYFLTPEEAILFTKWYIGYWGQEMPGYIEVGHEETDYYVVRTYDRDVNQAKGKDMAIPHQYQVDKRSGKIIPLDTEVVSKEVVHQDKMTYAVESDVLWMIDEQGNRGRLVNLDALYIKDYARKKESGEFLWQYGNNVYFVIRKYDTLDEYNEDTLWRYDLVQRKAVRLTETNSAFNRGVSYTLEAERGTIRIEYCPGRRELSRERIDPITGERQEWIAQYAYNGRECRIAEEGDLIYEVVRPEGEEAYFICEYNQTTKKRRLLCEVDTTDFYARQLPEPAIKVEDDIYFMDYTHYLTPEEEVAKENWEFEAAYCKVNVKTAQVSRVSKEAYEALLNN